MARSCSPPLSSLPLPPPLPPKAQTSTSPRALFAHTHTTREQHASPASTRGSITRRQRPTNACPHETTNLPPRRTTNDERRTTRHALPPPLIAPDPHRARALARAPIPRPASGARLTPAPEYRGPDLPRARPERLPLSRRRASERERAEGERALFWFRPPLPPKQRPSRRALPTRHARAAGAVLDPHPHLARPDARSIRLRAEGRKSSLPLFLFLSPPCATHGGAQTPASLSLSPPPPARPRTAAAERTERCS